MTISDNDFNREMARAQAAIQSTPEDAIYWRSYQNGLRRLYHGDKFSTPDMHRMRLSMINSSNPEGKRKGQGYKAGFEYGKFREADGRGRPWVGDVRLSAIMVPQSVSDNLTELCKKSKESPTNLRRRFLENGLLSESKKWGI